MATKYCIGFTDPTFLLCFLANTGTPSTLACNTMRVKRSVVIRPATLSHLGESYTSLMNNAESALSALVFVLLSSSSRSALLFVLWCSASCINFSLYVGFVSNLLICSRSGKYQHTCPTREQYMRYTVMNLKQTNRQRPHAVCPLHHIVDDHISDSECPCFQDRKRNRYNEHNRAFDV